MLLFPIPVTSPVSRSMVGMLLKELSALNKKDYSMGAFASFTKQFGKKVSLNASLSLQYYKASVDSAGKKRHYGTGPAFSLN